MARVAGLEWKAVGAGLDGLARKMQSVPAGAPSAFAYANSGVLQQVGVVMLARYITAENHYAAGQRRPYTSPPGSTHGPITTTKLSARGERFGRDKLGRWHNLEDSEVAQVITNEDKVFIRGKFVSRSGAMRETARDLSKKDPSESIGIIVWENNGQPAKNGEIEAGINKDGSGYISLSGGYRAAEVGSRNSRYKQQGVRGWWRSLRSVQGRWKTLLRKKYPDLMRLNERGTSMVNGGRY